MCIRDRGHPAGGKALSPETWSRLSHLAISSSEKEPGIIERSFGPSQPRRRIVARAPYLAAGAILASSDMVATMSRRIAQQFVRTNALQLRDLPFKPSAVRTAMLWHRTVDNHSAHRWLRDIVGSVARKL